MLTAKGLIAWQRALASLVPAPARRPAPGGPQAPLAAGLAGELISALAAVTLAAAGEVPP